MRVVSLSPLWNEDLKLTLDPGIAFVTADPKDRAARDEALVQAEILISAEFTAEMARAAVRLRLLICPAAGTEAIDRTALPPGVPLVSGTGHEIPMAEYVMGVLIALRQHLFGGDAALRRGGWRYGFHGPAAMLQEVYGSALGLVGFGRIGSEVAKRAAAFGMTCAALTLHPDKPRGCAQMLEFLGGLAVAADVDKLVSWSDALVLCCELSPQTRGLLDARRLELMKPSAVVINVSRGPVAVERDLYEALARGRIAGAALDVWYRYPRAPGAVQLPSGMPFQKLENVIMTPHSSAWTEQAKRRRLASMAKTINDFAREHGDGRE